MFETGELTFSSLKSIVESWGNKSESSSLSISNQLNYKDKLQNFKESRKKNKVYLIKICTKLTITALISKISISRKWLIAICLPIFIIWKIKNKIK